MIIVSQSSQTEKAFWLHCGPHRFALVITWVVIRQRCVHLVTVRLLFEQTCNPVQISAPWKPSYSIRPSSRALTRQKLTIIPNHSSGKTKANKFSSHLFLRKDNSSQVFLSPIPPARRKLTSFPFIYSSGKTRVHKFSSHLFLRKDESSQVFLSPIPPERQKLTLPDRRRTLFQTWSALRLPSVFMEDLCNSFM